MICMESVYFVCFWFSSIEFNDSFRWFDDSFRIWKRVEHEHAAAMSMSYWPMVIDSPLMEPIWLVQIASKWHPSLWYTNRPYNPPEWHLQIETVFNFFFNNLCWDNFAYGFESKSFLHVKYSPNSCSILRARSYVFFAWSSVIRRFISLELKIAIIKLVKMW